MNPTHALIVAGILVLPIIAELLGRKRLGRLATTLSAVALVLVLALGWAALHDILKGSEANYRQEVAVLALSLAVIFFLLSRCWSRARKPASTN